MDNSRLFSWIIALLLLTSFADIALASTLYGKIYDLELNEINNVIVSVNSEPAQRYVSKNGSYSFELNPGKYALTANYTTEDLKEYSTEDEFTVNAEGDYVYDLFLFPALEDDNDVIDDEIVELPATTDSQPKKSNTTLIILVILGIAILIIAYFIIGRIKKRKQKGELKEAGNLAKQEKQQRAPDRKHGNQDMDDDDLKHLVDIIRKEGGRTTQKDIRKQIPLSEAKISLMISELESKGVVEKVKKGRGNILILKKR